MSGFVLLWLLVPLALIALFVAVRSERGWGKLRAYKVSGSDDYAVIDRNGEEYRVSLAADKWGCHEVRRLRDGAHVSGSSTEIMWAFGEARDREETRRWLESRGIK